MNLYQINPLWLQVAEVDIDTAVIDIDAHFGYTTGDESFIPALVPVGLSIDSFYTHDGDVGKYPDGYGMLALMALVRSGEYKLVRVDDVG